MQGRIIKLISNQYDVWLENGDIVKCMARGKVRLNGLTPLAGDKVIVEKFDDKYGIEKILERTNFLKRPPIANVDQALIVMSAKEPDFSTTLVDQLIFLISLANIKPLLLITKMDLAKDDKRIIDLINDYRKSGYTVLLSGKDDIEEEKEKLAEVLKDKITVLAGQSGVGKSSLINKLAPDFKLETQEISKSLNRGKHTTRHVELHKVANGYVADTPGFSKLDFTRVKKDELANAINDFSEYIVKCKFRDCLHDKEPDCAIKKAVEEGKISFRRYKHYIECLRIIEEEGVEDYD